MSNFKFLLFLLAAINFCKASSILKELSSKIGNENGGNVEKSFTADCAANGDNATYCTYSLVIVNLYNTLTGTARIQVNGDGEAFQFQIAHPNIFFMTNFKVQKGDRVLIQFEVTSSSIYGYVVLDQANAEGYYGYEELLNLKGNIIFVSNDSPIYLINECQSQCAYEIRKTSENWNRNVKIQVYVNEVLQNGTFSGDPYTYSVKKGDSIKYSHTGNSLFEGLSVETIDLATPWKSVSNWKLEFYYSPVALPNYCQKTFDKSSPFGGLWHLLTPAQIELFAEENSGSAPWYLITKVQ